MKTLIISLTAWVVLVAGTCLLFALMNSFVVWPWEWEEPGRFVAVIVGLLWAWVIVAVNMEDDS